VQHAPPGNDPLDYIFGDLLDTFTPSETAVLAALTHFTQPAQVQWIADVAQLAAPQAQTALEDLADRALLVGDPAAQTFTLPPLAAQFLRAKRPEAVAQSGDHLADRAYAHWRAAKAGARQQATAIRLRGLGHRIQQDYAAAIAHRG
jgi:hypothetical protein